MAPSRTNVRNACVATALSAFSFSDGMAEERQSPHNGAYTAPHTSPTQFGDLSYPPSTHTSNSYSEWRTSAPHRTHPDFRPIPDPTRHDETYAHNYAAHNANYNQPPSWYQGERVNDQGSITANRSDSSNRQTFAYQAALNETSLTAPQRSGNNGDLLQALGTIASAVHNAVTACNPYVLMAFSALATHFGRKALISVARDTIQGVRKEADFGNTTRIEG